MEHLGAAVPEQFLHTQQPAPSGGRSRKKIVSLKFPFKLPPDLSIFLRKQNRELTETKNLLNKQDITCQFFDDPQDSTQVGTI